MILVIVGGLQFSVVVGWVGAHWCRWMVVALWKGRTLSQNRIQSRSSLQKTNGDFLSFFLPGNEKTKGDGTGGGREKFGIPTRQAANENRRERSCVLCCAVLCCAVLCCLIVLWDCQRLWIGDALVPLCNVSCCRFCLLPSLLDAMD